MTNEHDMIRRGAVHRCDDCDCDLGGAHCNLAFGSMEITRVSADDPSIGKGKTDWEALRAAGDYEGGPDEDEFEIDWSKARMVGPELHIPASDQVSDEARYLIRKHGGYYRPNSQGYTGSAIQAGRYTLAEAESITHPNGPDGPRDGMTYIHEDDVKGADWTAYRTLRAALTAAEGERDKFKDFRREFFAGYTGEAVALEKQASDTWKARAEAAEAQLAEWKADAVRLAKDVTNLLPYAKDAMGTQSDNQNYMVLCEAMSCARQHLATHEALMKREGG
jgi:hypothetical protein